MSTATLTFTDHNGVIDFHADFGPAGFKPESHAHQHALIAIKHIDSLCKQEDKPAVKAGILLPDGTVV